MQSPRGANGPVSFSPNPNNPNNPNNNNNNNDSTKMLLAQVILPLPLYTAYTYAVPPEMEAKVAVGMRVLVQFGPKKLYTALISSLHPENSHNAQPPVVTACPQAVNPGRPLHNAQPPVVTACPQDVNPGRPPHNAQPHVVTACPQAVHPGRPTYNAQPHVVTACPQAGNPGRPNDQTAPPSRPKPLLALLDDAPIIRYPQLRLWQWIADYYLCTLGDVFKAALPVGLRPESETFVTLSPTYLDTADPADPNDQSTPPSLKGEGGRGGEVASLLASEKRLRLSDIITRLNLPKSSTLISRLLDQGVIEIAESVSDRYRPKTIPHVRLNLPPVPPHKAQPHVVTACPQDVNPGRPNDNAQPHVVTACPQDVNPGRPNDQSALLASLARAPKQERLLLAYLSLSPTHGLVEKAALLARAEVTPAVLSAMVAKGIFTVVPVTVNRFNPSAPPSDSQSAASRGSGLSPGRSSRTSAGHPLPNNPNNNNNNNTPPSPLLSYEFIPPSHKGEGARGVGLSSPQLAALASIRTAFQTHAVTLLRGVTGSGKTEIYSALISSALAEGHHVLYLVPEISLTTQLTDRLRRVFGSRLLVYHSRFSDNERVDLWRRVLQSSEPLVVIGARSALFLPFPRLGLVVVDEEHDTSYKQSDPAPRYNARDVAIVLASMHGCKTLLGSATPSVETYYKATTGKYGLVELLERYDSAPLPSVTIVDTRRPAQPSRGYGLSPDAPPAATFVGGREQSSQALPSSPQSAAPRGSSLSSGRSSRTSEPQSATPRGSGLSSGRSSRTSEPQSAASRGSGLSPGRSNTDPSPSSIHPLLHSAILSALRSGRQSILFRNRRGFAPYVTCRSCGWTPRCRDCDVSLVYHKHTDSLHCHYCGYTLRRPALCPDCGQNTVDVFGYGTERVEESVAQAFPDARVARLDLDTTRRRDAYHDIITTFSEGKTDILVGTQMVSKGLDFGGVRVVGVLNADSVLTYPDYRAAERAFNMLEQVAGRAGRRKDDKGEVIIQTTQPSNPVVQYVRAHDYLAFYEAEIQARRELNYPPFTRIIMVYVKNKDDARAGEAADLLAAALRDVFGSRVLGPDRPFVSRISTWYIRQLMLKIEVGASLPKVKAILRAIYTSLARDPRIRSSLLYYDVDP